jgi:hypothetical protein
VAGVRARSPRGPAPKESRPGAVRHAGPKPVRQRGAEPRKFLVLSGPNLNRLGVREPGIYGKLSLEQIHALLATKAEELGVLVDCRQSNHEGTLLDWIGDCQSSGFAGILTRQRTRTRPTPSTTRCSAPEFRPWKCICRIPRRAMSFGTSRSRPPPASEASPGLVRIPTCSVCRR